MALTREEFEAKYHFPKPYTLRERDMIIMSNLSDVPYWGEDTRTKINSLKEFMLDTQDLFEQN